MSCEYLTTEEAAEVLRLRPTTLEHWRTVRKGPPFVRVGPRCVRYRSTDLDLWLSQQSIATN